MRVMEQNQRNLDERVSSHSKVVACSYYIELVGSKGLVLLLSLFIKF
jgi:hypothetical protein